MSIGPIKVDFSNVQTFEPVPSGIYVATVAAVEMKTGNSSGQPYLNWTFSIAEGEFANRKLWGMTSLQPQALFGIKNLIEAVTGETLADEANIEPEALVGRPVRLQVTTETYEGVERNKIQKYLPLA